MKMRIKSIKVREILNSRAQTTIEVELGTDSGFFSASVPSGVSKGRYEAVYATSETALKNIEKIIAPALEGKDFHSQKQLDEILIALDGTENKSKLGANAILAVSMAGCRALAEEQKLALYQYISVKPYESCPRPAVLMIEGGKHAGNNLDVQEFLIVPQEDSFKKSLWSGVAVFEALEGILEKKFGKSATNLGEEGGFAPPLKKTEEALQLITRALKKTGVEAGIALDAAASHFYQDGSYRFEGKKQNPEKMLEFYQCLVKKYPILFLEDPFCEDDIAGWKGIMNYELGIKNLLVVGDDLITTNPKRIKIAKEKELCNGVIVKPNQIGTVTEAVEAVKLAKGFGWKIIVSHRAGETNDDFIADFAVGVAADFVKFGAPARGERVAKYNRLLKIEEELSK